MSAGFPPTALKCAAVPQTAPLLFPMNPLRPRSQQVRLRYRDEPPLSRQIRAECSSRRQAVHQQLHHRQKGNRTDIDVYYVPCNEIADKLNNPKVANMAMLGAYLEATKAVQTKSVLDALLYKLGEKKAALIPLNEEAIEAGAASIRK